MRVWLWGEYGEKILSTRTTIPKESSALFYAFAKEGQKASASVHVYSGKKSLGQWSGGAVRVAIPKGGAPVAVTSQTDTVFVAPSLKSNIFTQQIAFPLGEKASLHLETEESAPFDFEELVRAAARSNLLPGGDLPPPADCPVILSGIYSDGLITMGVLNRNETGLSRYGLVNGETLKLEVADEGGKNLRLYSLQYNSTPEGGLTRIINLLHKEDRRYRGVPHMLGYAALPKLKNGKEGYLFMAILNRDDFCQSRKGGE